MRYLIFTTEQAAIVKEAEISQALGYPNEETKTDRYCDVIKHSTLEEWSVCIEEAYSHPQKKQIEIQTILRSSERAVLKDQDWFDANGWTVERDRAWFIRQGWKNKKGEPIWTLKDGKLVHNR